jgi:hypothetical protein
VWRLLNVLLACTLASAEDKLTLFQSTPFEVYTAAGDKQGREVLNRLLQFRHALGTTLGKPELETVWPVRVVVTKTPSDLSLTFRRDAYIAGSAAPDLLPALARLFIDQNAGRMPAAYEQGLITLFSTIDIKGTRVTLGAPPPPAERTLDWARMHMLSVQPEYSGKLRVLLGNLQRGVAADAAFSNAFQKTPEAIERETTAYLAAGQFGTVALSGRPLALRDFAEKEADGLLSAIVMADLRNDRAAYETARKRFPSLPEPLEGLGLWKEAVAAGSKNACAHLEAGAPAEAARLNPKWAEPHIRMAEAAPNASVRVHHLELAVALEPRTAALWEKLALTYQGASQFALASKAWAAAERAAPTEAERERMRTIQRDIEQKRLEEEENERRRIAMEKQREIDRLRNEALMRIREAEAKASKGKAPVDESKIEQWWDGPQADGKIRGTLARVDCGRGGLRLLLKIAGGKTMQLAVRDPSQVVLKGGGQTNLTCGTQTGVKAVTVEYIRKTDAKAGVAGEAVSIEFH